MTSLPGVSFPPSIVGRLAGVDHWHHGHGRGVNDDQLARCRSTRRHVRAVGNSPHWPASIVGTTGTAARASRGDRGTMTSLPALALPASIVGTLPDPGVSFPPSIIGRLAGVDHRHHGDGRGVNDDQLPAVSFPGVDHRHHGHGRGEGPGAATSTMTSLPGAGLAGVNRRHAAKPRR